jgi:NADH dehydrogenase
MSGVLVLGGSGFVGLSVCEKLVEYYGGADAQITVPSRHPARAREIQPLPTVVLERADVNDDAQLRRLVGGHDVVIHLIATLHGSERDFQRLHVDLPKRVAAACHDAGVRRVVHVSSLGADASAPSRYLRSKAAGEAAWRDSGLDVTVLRPSVIFGECDRFMNRFASLQRIFPVMPLAGANARFQPVWVDDVAAAVVRCVDDRSTIGATFECTGPTVYTLAELVRLAGRWSGHERPIVPLPQALGRLQAMLLEWLPGEPVMSRDNLDSMRVDNVATGTLPGLDRLGITPTPLEAVMPVALGWRAGPARLEPWRASARRG